MELGIAADESGAYEDVGVDAVADSVENRYPAEVLRERARLSVRLGDVVDGELVPLDRAPSLARPGLVRAFLAGGPAAPATVSGCK